MVGVRLLAPGDPQPFDDKGYVLAVPNKSSLVDELYRRHTMGGAARAERPLEPML